MILQEEVEALEILGHVYFRQGRMREAHIVFAGLLALAPENEVARRHLAALALDRGDGGETLRLLDAYMEGRPESNREPAVLLLRGQALRRIGRNDDAEKVFAAYLRNPGDTT
jgi:predicted Zn-dependent protease